MSFQRDFLSKRISDPLAKKVHDLGQLEYAQNFQVQNIDTLNVQILSIKTKTKTLSKDKFHVSVKSYDPDQRFYNATYPDRNKLKLWLKGENSDKLHDYSLLNHEAHLWSSHQVAEQYLRDDPNNMAGHEIVSHANGTHYIHAMDERNLRISDLIVDEPTATGFTIVVRFNPLSAGNSNQDSRIIEQKIDSSQNRYGHSINIDDKGNVYFYVRYNYRQYFCKLDSPIPIPRFIANFKETDYKPQNYKTLSEIDFNELVADSYDLVCEFNYSTKECSIKVLHDETIIASVKSLSGTGSLPTSLQLHLPLQEGKWSETKTLPNNVPMNQVFDSSGNQQVGTINQPANADWQLDNTLKNNGSASAGTLITFPNNVNVNNFTEMTLAFWYNPVSNNTLVTRLFMKGYDNTPYFKIHRSANSNDLKFSVSIDANGATNIESTVNNAFPTFNTWYFIVCKWKTGQQTKVSINNQADVLSAGTKTGSINSPTQPFSILDWRTDNSTMINVMFFNRQINATEQTTLFNYGAHLAQFPTNLEPQRLPDPSPTPKTNPISTIYDLPKIASPTINDYTFINNPTGQNPFTAKYTAPDGVASGIPEATIYNIAAGSGGTTVNPFATPYTLTGINSTGQIVYSSTASSNEWAYVQYITINTSVLFNQKFTEIQVSLNGLGNPTGGSVYLGIVKNDGTVIKFGTAIDPASIPDTWTPYTKQLLTNTYPLAVNDGIGIIWENGTGGAINVQRGGSDTHFDVDGSGNPRSCQNGRRGAGAGSWKTENPQYSMAGTLKTGGDTVGTSPYGLLRSASGFVYQYGEIFPSGSPMVGEIPTYAAFRVYRDSAATAGQVSIRHVKADGTYYATLYEVNVSTLPTTEPTTFNFIWQNVDYTNQILAGERIAVVVNASTVGTVFVLSNLGNNAAGNSYDTTRSCVNTRAFTGGTFANSPTIDISGVIKKGGSSFVPIIKFSAAVTRIYERAVNASSVFYDQPLSKIIVRGKRTGTIPSPATMTCVLRNNANVEKVVIGTFDANAVSTSAYQDIPFTNNNNTIKVAVGDYVSIGLATCDASNFIELNMTRVIDGTNSIMGTLDSGVITDLASYDLAGTFYIGGQIDNVSRPRVAQYIDTQDSIFLTVPNNRITILDATLIGVGAPSGTVYFNIRRGTDDALIFTLGSVSAGSITTALAGTTVHITNFNNTYILAAKDKISIEFEGGDQTNRIGVQIRTYTPDYDGINSYISRFNGVEYDYINTKDLAAKMQVGGDTYLPDANAPPPVLPQNSTDLYILADPTKRDSSFLRCIFGMYLFFHTLLTDDDLMNFNRTRIDTGSNLSNSIQCTNHSFFRNS